LNIAFFGSSLVSAYWNGAATYYRGIIRNLHALGHRITFYEPNAFERQQHRDIPDPSWARVHVYSTDGTGGVYRAIEDARKQADCVVKASGVGVFDPLLEREVLSARKPGQSVVFWDVDAPATLDRLAGNENDAFHACVARYDMVLTYGGGEPVVKAYKAIGARECVPIYNALDPETHYPVEGDARSMRTSAFLATGCPTVKLALRSSSWVPHQPRQTRHSCWEEAAGQTKRFRRT
jgi:spore maturation protein CgeB